MGLELDTASGKNNGSVAGVSYFSCAPHHGVFVRPHSVASVSRGEAVRRHRGSHQGKEELFEEGILSPKIKSVLKARRGKGGVSPSQAAAAARRERREKREEILRARDARVAAEERKGKAGGGGGGGSGGSGGGGGGGEEKRKVGGVEGIVPDEITTGHQMELFTQRYFSETALRVLQHAQNILLEARLRKRVDQTALALLKDSLDELPILLRSLHEYRAKIDPGYTDGADSSLAGLYAHVKSFVDMVSTRLPQLAAAVTTVAGPSPHSPAPHQQPHHQQPHPQGQDGGDDADGSYEVYEVYEEVYETEEGTESGIIGAGEGGVGLGFVSSDSDDGHGVVPLQASPSLVLSASTSAAAAAATQADSPSRPRGGAGSVVNDGSAGLSKSGRSRPVMHAPSAMIKTKGSRLPKSKSKTSGNISSGGGGGGDAGDDGLDEGEEVDEVPRPRSELPAPSPSPAKRGISHALNFGNHEDEFIEHVKSRPRGPASRHRPHRHHRS